jgi:hypothetical protein
MPALNLLITRIDVWMTPMVGRVPEDGGDNPLVDLHTISKASYFQVQCVDDTTGGAGP